MPKGVLSLSLDWLIIGGGIHGVHIAARLLGEAGISPDRLRIVDPGERLLEHWQRCTATTGMTHLRSPSVHHLDLDPWSLERFAGKRKRRKSLLLKGRYGKPALSLFNSHCEKVIDTFGLEDLHITDRALTCSVECDEVRVQLASGSEMRAHNLVLAIGTGEQPNWPQWAPREHDFVHHIFEPSFDGWPSSCETVAVVGGGISSAQVALRLLEQEHHVHMISRHGLREEMFDSAPGWLGPRYMTRFWSEPDFDQRRVIINEARNRGSMPPEVRRLLRRAMTQGQLIWHQAAVEGLDEHGTVLRFRLRGRTHLDVDRVLLATGFSSKRPGGALVDGLIQSASLPCAECGYPVVDSGLRWHSNVYVSGPLAELELGPVSRNIAGARRAAERLVAVARNVGSRSMGGS